MKNSIFYLMKHPLKFDESHENSHESHETHGICLELPGAVSGFAAPPWSGAQRVGWLWSRGLSASEGPERRIFVGTREFNSKLVLVVITGGSGGYVIINILIFNI